jgi:hypothetical protein
MKNKWEKEFDELCDEKKIPYIAVAPLYKFIQKIIKEETFKNVLRIRIEKSDIEFKKLKELLKKINDKKVSRTGYFENGYNKALSEMKDMVRMIFNF